MPNGAGAGRMLVKSRFLPRARLAQAQKMSTRALEGCGGGGSLRSKPKQHPGEAADRVEPLPYPLPSG